MSDVVIPTQTKLTANHSEVLPITKLILHLTLKHYLNTKLCPILST